MSSSMQPGNMAYKAPLAALLLLAPTQAWYLPGVAPHDFHNGERVYLKVNKLTSTKTQVMLPLAPV